MSFSPHSSTFNSATQPQNMNSYNNGTYIQNVMPPFQGYPFPYQNSMQCPTFYPQQLQNNYNTNRYYNCSTRNTETSITGPKREVKPLIVIDPTKNEVINLIEVSKTSKSLINEIKTVPNNTKTVHISSLTTLSVTNKPKSSYADMQEMNNTNELEMTCSISDKSQIIMTKEEQDEICEKKEDEITYEEGSNMNECVEKNIYEIEDEKISETSNDSEDKSDTSKDNFTNMKQSKSIPHEMESLFEAPSDNLKQSSMSLSENSLYENVNKCISIETCKSRRIYNRDALMRISKSPLCKKPDFDCKEILETQASKVISLLNRTSYTRTVHGYMPPHLRLNVVCSQNTYLDENRRNFKCVLNKIAPQNFDLCFSEIISLITKTDLKDVSLEDSMDCLIEEIFDKAVKEEAYSVTYADLCTRIVRYDEKHDMKWSFKNSLIKRCKLMFETPLQDQLKTVREHWEKKVEEEPDRKMQILYKSEIEEQVKKAKDKFFGNIRFIGELYRHDLLTAKIINMCVQNLMSKRNEEDAILSLCKLLETCGKKFDEIHNDKMKEYISGMKEIAETEDLNNRIKFRLFDIIDMSGRNWMLRKVQAQKIIQPKTLEQVKKDDLDEKIFEASKLANTTHIRLNKKSNPINNDLKFKPSQSRTQAFEFSSLQMQTSDNIELKPSYRKWAAGSGSKDPEWQNVDGKRNKGYNRPSNKYSPFNSKSSPITSCDESPSKVDIGGRFALLQQNDVDDNIDLRNNTFPQRQYTPEPDKETQNNTTSLPSSREQSPVNLKCDTEAILDGDGIFEKLLDSHYLEIESWNQLDNVSSTITIWLDRIMEKGKATRNMVGDELAKLLRNAKLSLDDLTNGIATFSEDIDDLKTDIPLIWNFMAEFLERFIVDAESDINFYKTIFQSQVSTKDVSNCIRMCFKFADERLGHKIVRSVFTKNGWSYDDLMKHVDPILCDNTLDFLLQDLSVNSTCFDQFKDELIALLPKDDEEIHQFLDDKFGSEKIQTEDGVYFVSVCVFCHLSDLPAEDIISFLSKRKLFFLRLLDRRSEFETELLNALKDSVTLFKEIGLLTSVIYGLSDNILSYEAFQQFIQRESCCSSNSVVTSKESTNDTLIADVIRSMLDTRRR